MATRIAAKPYVWAFIVLSLVWFFIPVISSDVPDGVVYTELHKTVQKGSRAVLTCEFYRTPLAVYWKKGDDPTAAPNLITWVEGEPESGSCVADKTCEMGDDFSLIIKNISIADQGLYICRVSNYLGILIHNFTDVRVFALPKDPYPIINECMDNYGEHCNVSTSISTNITCTVQRYFPTVDLFFLHDSRKYTTSDISEDTNTDGTKNKTISTVALSSEMPYVCVASNIPGSQNQRTATVSVINQDDVTSGPNTRFPNSTTSSSLAVPSNPNVIKIAVPIVVVFGLLVAVLLYLLHWRKRRDHRLTEAKHDGEDQHMITIPKMQIKGSGGNRSPLVLRNLFEHILWDIGNIEQINQFLRELIPSQAATITGKMRDAVKSASSKMEEWIKDIHDEHSFILLSQALERADCNRVARTFFIVQVPEKLQSLITPSEVTGFTNKLTSRHCTRLAMALQSDTNEINDIISMNNMLLFDTRLMITEWLRDEECSNYQKRCRLDDAILKIGRYDLHDCFGTVEHRRNTGSLQKHQHPSSYQFDHESIFDDDIPQLLKLIDHLPGDKKTQLHKRIGFEPDVTGAIRHENVVKMKLEEWRNNMVNSSKEKPQEQIRALRKAITSTTYSEMAVTNEEIESVASYVTSAGKQQELTTVLDIKTGVQRSFADQLNDWRNAQSITICRETLRKALGCKGLAECIVNRIASKYMYQTELAGVAFYLLMEDVRPIIEALGMKQSRVRKYIQPALKLEHEGTMGLVLELKKGKNLRQERDRDDFCRFALRDNGFINVSRSVYLEYVPSLSELFNIALSIDEDKMVSFLDHLDLDQDDIAECQDEKGQTDKMKLMRLWKHKIRPVPYHYRLELAFALKASELNGIASNVLSGHFRTGIPHSDVLHNILSRFDNDMIGILCTLLKIGETGDRAGLVSLLVNWVIKWVDEFHSNEKRFLSSPLHRRDHRQTNELLFSNGFGELAEEISALEHCLPQSNTAPLSEHLDDSPVTPSSATDSKTS